MREWETLGGRRRVGDAVKTGRGWGEWGRQGGFGREWGDPGNRYTVTGVGTEGLWRAGK